MLVFICSTSQIFLKPNPRVSLPIQNNTIFGLDRIKAKELAGYPVNRLTEAKYPVKRLAEAKYPVNRSAEPKLLVKRMAEPKYPVTISGTILSGHWISGATLQMSISTNVEFVDA